MIPLTCVNCCHNPLQLGTLGTAFGFCTRHQVVLNRPQLTTCGQQFRKDLLAESAVRQRTIHASSYPDDQIVSVSEPRQRATESGMTELPSGQTLLDAVVEEVQNYGHLDSKIASMAALRRIEGARAEVARISLSRSYFSNCVSRGGGTWTSGVHLLHWTLANLDQDPAIAASDIRGPIPKSLEQTIKITRWTVVAFRLAFASDVGRVAVREGDEVGLLATLAGEAVAASGNDPDRLLHWLKRNRKKWSNALPWPRYLELKAQLHVAEGAA